MTISSFRRRGIVCLAAMAMALTALPAAGQITGDKPIRLIVPLTAGSTVDAVARAMGNEMSRALGHSVMVDNLVGAGGMIGTAQLVRAPKDGMTIAMVSSNHVINPSIYKSVPFDSLRDITPVSIIGTVPLVLVVPSASPIRDVRGLIAAAREKPDALNYGSAGNGSVLHLAAELLKSEAGGIKLTHVPYKGTGPLTTDLIGGQVQLGFLSVTAAAPHIRSGKLRALGVSTPTRTPILPEVPALAEQGLPHYSFDAWLALIAPAGLAPSSVARLHAATRSALATKQVQDALAAQGIVIIGSGPDVAPQFFRAELEKHAKLVKESGAVAE